MISLLVDLHRDGKRQGPGGDDETRLAVTLSGLSDRTGLTIADIGCGTGASTLVLAKALDASVTAVDFLPDFLHDLDIAAKRQNLGEKITTLSASMDALPFEVSCRPYRSTMTPLLAQAGDGHLKFTITLWFRSVLNYRPTVVASAAT